MLPTRSIALCGAGHCDTSIPPRALAAAPRQRSVPHRRRSRAADATSRAADKKGVCYWVVVEFDMNIIDFLVTLNVTVSRMINWRNTASQIGHTVTK
jgi:hypothetical protein